MQNLMNPYPHITARIAQDLRRVSDKPLQGFHLLRAKQGVYVYKCRYDDRSAVVKYFENESDRRELCNYRILTEQDIPTLQTLAMGDATLVMEDITLSSQWRLGTAADLADTTVAKDLAHWYFTLHENGAAAEALSSLYFEYERITEDNLRLLSTKLPEAAPLFSFLLTHFEKLRSLLFQPAFTLTYNDFYWTNLVVRKNGQGAMMFDYNLLGRGYRYADMRNVCSSLSKESGQLFSDEYHRLYAKKHGHARLEEEQLEKRIDDVLGPLFALLVAFTEHSAFPAWAEEERVEVLSGSLLSKAEQLLL